MQRTEDVDEVHLLWMNFIMMKQIELILNQVKEWERLDVDPRLWLKVSSCLPYDEKKTSLLKQMLSVWSWYSTLIFHTWQCCITGSRRCWPSRVFPWQTALHLHQELLLLPWRWDKFLCIFSLRDTAHILQRSWRWLNLQIGKLILSFFFF